MCGKRLLMAVALLVGVCGCRSGAYPVGILYNGTTIPQEDIDKAELGGAPKPGEKVGEACATGILGMVAWGDASVDAAKRAGGITEVHSVEYKPTAVLVGAYFSACTVVHGK
jgi:hypothetical protein